MQCNACGTQKDMTQLETYPYPEDMLDTEEPDEPLLPLDCTGEGGCRQVWVCYECWHKIKPDMWIDKRIWESLNPVTPFSDLPLAPKE